MTYKEFIDNIIETRGRHGCGEEYHEKHHIVPRCLGGEDKEENYIDLFGREHFEAHRLLALENPHENGLIRAWFLMSHVKNNGRDKYVKVTAEEYEEARTAYIDSMSGENNRWFGTHGPMYGRAHTAETKQRLSKANKGHKTSQETRDKLREQKMGKNNPMYGKHQTEDFKQMMHKRFSGENHPNYGKHPTKETRQKMSESAKRRSSPMKGKHFSEESKQKLSKAVLCIESNIVYFSMHEAEKCSKATVQNISKCCKGKRKTAGGCHWRYATKEEIERMNKGDE